LFSERPVVGLALENSAPNRSGLASALCGGVHGNRLRVTNVLVNGRALAAPNWPNPEKPLPELENHFAQGRSVIAVDFLVAPRHYGGMKLLERITVEPGKCGGRPCIRGLRIRVTDILGMLAEGVAHDEILRDFPYLEPDDIKAALAYAARQADHAVLQPS